MAKNMQKYCKGHQNQCFLKLPLHFFQKPRQILNKINTKNMIENVYKINAKRANLATKSGVKIK